MYKKSQKTDKVTCTILAAFILMSGTHFTCRYNVGEMLDKMFQKVSAETVLPNASAPAPVAVEPVTAPTTREEVINTAGQKTITRNPFAVPAVAQTRQQVTPTRSSVPGSPALPSAGQVQAAAPVTDETPHLKGVVQSGNKSMAIIEYKGSSSAYRPGQSVGGYTVNDIGSSSVGLSGGNGSVRIAVGG